MEWERAKIASALLAVVACAASVVSGWSQRPTIIQTVALSVALSVALLGVALPGTDSISKKVES